MQSLLEGNLIFTAGCATRGQRRMYCFVCFVALSAENVLSNTPTERLVGLICLIMFVVGSWLAGHEVVRWWKVRMAKFESPPLASLITYERDSDKRWRPTKVLWFPLAQTSSFPRELKPRVADHRPTDMSGEEERAA